MVAVNGKGRERRAAGCWSLIPYHNHDIHCPAYALPFYVTYTLPSNIRMEQQYAVVQQLRRDLQAARLLHAATERRAVERRDE